MPLSVSSAASTKDSGSSTKVTATSASRTLSNNTTAKATATTASKVISSNTTASTKASTTVASTSSNPSSTVGVSTATSSTSSNTSSIVSAETAAKATSVNNSAVAKNSTIQTQKEENTSSKTSVASSSNTSASNPNSNVGVSTATNVSDNNTVATKTEIKTDSNLNATTKYANVKDVTETKTSTNHTAGATVEIKTDVNLGNTSKYASVKDDTVVTAPENHTAGVTVSPKTDVNLGNTNKYASVKDETTTSSGIKKVTGTKDPTTALGIDVQDTTTKASGITYNKVIKTDSNLNATTKYANVKDETTNTGSGSDIADWESRRVQRATSSAAAVGVTTGNSTITPNNGITDTDTSLTTTTSYNNIKWDHCDINFIYFYHLDVYCVIPVWPEITDTMGSSFSQSTALGRSAPVMTYSGSGPRSFQVTLDLHRDMLQDMEVYKIYAVNKRENSLDFSDLDGYIDKFIKYLEASAYPKYTIYSHGSKSVEPPMVALRFGDDIFIKGVITSGISVTYKLPIITYDGMDSKGGFVSHYGPSGYGDAYSQQHYGLVSVSFTVTEVDPYDAETISQIGSFRGMTAAFSTGVFKNDTEAPEFQYTNFNGVSSSNQSGNADITIYHEENPVTAWYKSPKVTLESDAVSYKEYEKTVADTIVSYPDADSVVDDDQALKIITGGTDEEMDLLGRLDAFKHEYIASKYREYYASAWDWAQTEYAARSGLYNKWGVTSAQNLFYVIVAHNRSAEEMLDIVDNQCGYNLESNLCRAASGTGVLCSYENLVRGWFNSLIILESTGSTYSGIGHVPSISNSNLKKWIGKIGMCGNSAPGTMNGKTYLFWWDGVISALKYDGITTDKQYKDNASQYIMADGYETGHTSGYNKYVQADRLLKKYILNRDYQTQYNKIQNSGLVN